MGAGLILSARNKEKLSELSDELTEKYSVPVEVMPLDLEDDMSVSNALKYVRNNFQSIDILVNNAGISQRSLVVDTPVSIDRKIFEINYFGAVILTKGILPMMINSGGGHIVVMSSVVGKFGIPLRSAYSASKHALHGFFDTLRSELVDKNIKVTIICPGRIATNISLNAVTKDGSTYNIMDEGQAKGIDSDVFAKRIIKAVKRNKKESIMGGKEVLMVYIRRFLPWLYYILASRVKPT